MSCNVVEVNERTGILQANDGRRWLGLFGIIIYTDVKVEIIEIEKPKNLYKVKIVYERPKSLAKQSKFTNRFINELISEPRVSEDKDRGVKNISLGGEG